MFRSALLLVLLVVGPARAQSPEAPSDGDPAVENLDAFAQLYGLVRFFHPSDEAADVEWNRFAVLGAARVIDAETPEALADSLRSVFGPIAPSVTIAVGEAPAAVPLPEGDVVVAWQHLGVRLSDDPNVYRSVRLGRQAPPEPEVAAPFGVLVRNVDATDLRGRRVRLSAAVRAERGAGQLWLRVDRPDQEMAFFDNMEDRPVTSPLWAQYVIEGPVADDAVGLAFGGLVSGDAGATFDAFQLEVEGDGGWTEVPIENGSFEDGAGAWFSQSPGYTSETVGHAADGERAFRVARRQAETGPAAALFEARPELGDVTIREIGRGVAVRVPLALPSRDGQTLPAADVSALAALRADLAGLVVEGNAPATRAADGVVAASVFEHFYPYADLVDLDWDEVRTEALAAALAAETPTAHCRGLQVLVARLRDGHGHVACAGAPAMARLPFVVERVEGRATVVAADDAAEVRLGDVVLAVDGVDAEVHLDSLAALASGSPQWRLRKATREFGAGPEGSTARVAVDRGGRRVEVEAPRVQGAPPQENRPEPIAELRPGVLYVDVSRASDSLLTTRMADIVGADGVVVDVRGYPREIGPWFLSVFADRPVVSALWEVLRTIRPDDPGGVGVDTSRWAPMPPATPRAGGRVVFLTDARAISYAESMLGIVDHYDLGTTVGGPTAGANGNVNPFWLPGGHRVWWTGMRVRKHDGSTLHGVGIAPDVPVSRTLEGVRAGRDEVLERAVEIAAGGE